MENERRWWSSVEKLIEVMGRLKEITLGALASAPGNFTSSKADSKADSKALSKRELSSLSLQPLFSILQMRKRLNGKYK